MQVVILAWGLGTRLSEETIVKPKPMVEIGGKPILWHIMKNFSYYGHKEFIICLGYKGYYIKEWFANYFLHNSDVTIDTKNNKIEVHNNNCEDWKVTLVDTWDNTMTWGRIKKIIDSGYIKWGEFLMTYGDGVGNVDINNLTKFHKKHWKLATITRVQPEWRFWKLIMDWDNIIKFWEKLDNKDAWINWWFMVLNRKIVDYIKWDEISLEKYPLETLSNEWQLVGYAHEWFWKPMDTIRDRNELEDMWNSWNAPWKLC
ncbi:MAG: hypothetical protein ACD_4C00066G0003 [uncultured bacterium (gcode 4)]|uniref:Nucleotidyl transferase domain-containing protein n=1 Tax=uncultured bacterium (gcode 4) TaxID=1234023 RepID=K2FYT8_9BACT|nr:MAG: hypothetical protein ACD_4C00066G0003 [uncultured bacterium (gcode 4)]